MSRSTCPRGLEKKLNREVHHYCPICGGFPLVRAHTLKTYSEVGWNYEYLLSICLECEKKVESNQITRQLLHEIKQGLRLSYSTSRRNTPRQLAKSSAKMVSLGNNEIIKTDIIVKHGQYPMIWFDLIDDTRVLSARFYDKNGTVITAIDKNQWTADRSRFYEIETKTHAEVTTLVIKSKVDDTNVKLIISQDSLTICESSFYIVRHKFKINTNCDLSIDGNTFSKSKFIGGGAAIFIQQ